MDTDEDRLSLDSDHDDPMDTEGGESSDSDDSDEEEDDPGQGINETSSDSSSGAEEESGGSDSSDGADSPGGSGDSSEGGSSPSNSSSGGEDDANILRGLAKASSSDDDDFHDANSDSHSRHDLRQARRELADKDEMLTLADVQIQSLEADNKRLRDKNADLEAENAVLQVEKAMLADTLGKGKVTHPVAASLLEHAPASLPSEKIAMHNARTYPKASTYNGTSGTDLRPWFLTVQTYVFGVSWLVSQLVPGAAALLTGDAALWWALEQPLLRQRGLNPMDWWVFAEALFSRWYYLNAEASAMTKLRSFQQGNRPIEVYLREFTALTSQVYGMTDKQKCFDFLYGLSPYWQDKLGMNPAKPGEGWTSFAELSAFVIAVASTSSRRAAGIVHNAADAVHHTVGGGVQKQKGKGKGYLAAAERGAQAQGSGGGRHRSSGAGTSGGAGSSRSGGAGPSSAAGGGSSSQSREYTNAAAAQPSTFNRSAAVKEYCMHNKLCLCCYRPGHILRDCKSQPAVGNPRGFGSA